VTANTVTASYSYDANGNATSASGTIYPASGSVAFSRTLTYTSFNLPSSLSHTQGASTYSYTYTYSAEHQRVKLITERPNAYITTYYVNPSGSSAPFYEKELRCPTSAPCAESAAIVERRHYITGPMGLIGVWVTSSDGTSAMRYFHRDQIGSVVRTTNGAGAATDVSGYEAFGERRDLDGDPEDRSSPNIVAVTDRGFTGHEHLDEMMLIHMNGRIFDPILGRFMTPDPFVQAPQNLQSYNRYSYGFNNPLSGVDPSGYGFFDDLFDAADAIIEGALQNPVKTIATIAVAYYTGQWIGEGLAASGADWAVAGSWGASSEFGIVVNSGYVLTAGGSAVVGASVGFTAGIINGGSPQSGFRGAISGGLLGGIDGYFGQDLTIQRVAARAFGSGLAARIQGGLFEDGFLTSAVNSAARYLYNAVTNYDVSLSPGGSRAGPGIPCGELGSSCYKPIDGGYVPAEFSTVNVIGHNEMLEGDYWKDFFKQSGAGSQALNLIPMGNALAIFHDTWMNRTDKNMFTNLPSVIPSFVVTYRAVMDTIPVYGGRVRDRR